MSGEYDNLEAFMDITLAVCYSRPGLLTKKFIDLIKEADDGILDLNKAADTLHVGTLPLISY